MSRDLRSSYRRAVAKCITDHEEPSLGQIKVVMCYQGYCPNKECNFRQGRKHGEDCGHVLAVLLLTNKVNNVLMGN